MPTYRAIAGTETDPEAPITSSLMKAFQDNVLAIAEDDATAPKIKIKHFVSAAEAQTQTFTGLGDYSGISFDLRCYQVAGGTQAYNFQYSTNGGTSWSTAVSMFSLPVNAVGFYSGAFDFSSGLLAIIGGQADVGATSVRVSTTVSGASLSIDAIRFQGAAASVNLVAIIRPNGGTA